MKHYDDIILREDGTIEKVITVTIPDEKIKTCKISLIEAARLFVNKPKITIHDETQESNGTNNC